MGSSTSRKWRNASCGARVLSEAAMRGGGHVVDTWRRELGAPSSVVVRIEPYYGTVFLDIPGAPLLSAYWSWVGMGWDGMGCSALGFFVVPYSTLEKCGLGRI